MLRKSTCLAALLSIILFAGAASAQDAGEGPAYQLLRKVARSYRSLDEYEAKISVTETMTAGEQKRESVIEGTIRMVRPDRLRVDLTANQRDFTLNCGPEQCFAYFPSTGKFLRWEASENLDPVLTHQTLLVMLGELGRPTLLPLSSEPYDALTRGVKSARLLPPEPADEGRGRHLVLGLTSGDMDVWVDPETYAITAARMVPTRMIEQLQKALPDVDELSISIRLTQKRSPQKQVEAATFEFRPPEGATRVSSTVDLLKQGPPKSLVDFDLPALEEGERWRLSEHRGKVIALDFWATWCPPCRDELPALAEIHEEYAERGLLLLAVNLREDRETVKAFLDRMELDIPVALDRQAAAATKYGVSNLPTLVLIGREGTIEARHTGYRPGDEEKIREEIEALLAGESLE